MQFLPRILETLSKLLYWLSMGAAGAAVVSYGSYPDKQLAYAMGLLSVVSMLTSSALLYGRNIIAVGKEIAAPPEACEDSNPDNTSP